eukprot:CFRG4021T1
MWHVAHEAMKDRCVKYLGYPLDTQCRSCGNSESEHRACSHYYADHRNGHTRCLNCGIHYTDHVSCQHYEPARAIVGLEFYDDADDDGHWCTHCGLNEECHEVDECMRFDADPNNPDYCLACEQHSTHHEVCEFFQYTGSYYSKQKRSETDLCDEDDYVEYCKSCGQDSAKHGVCSVFVKLDEEADTPRCVGCGQAVEKHSTCSRFKSESGDGISCQTCGKTMGLHVWFSYTQAHLTGAKHRYGSPFDVRGLGCVVEGDKERNVFRDASNDSHDGHGDKQLSSSGDGKTVPQDRDLVHSDKNSTMRYAHEQHKKTDVRNRFHSQSINKTKMKHAACICVDENAIVNSTVNVVEDKNRNGDSSEDGSGDVSESANYNPTVVSHGTVENATVSASAIKGTIESSLSKTSSTSDNDATSDDKCTARAYVDGEATFEAMALAMRSACKEILICGWILSPEIYMERGMNKNGNRGLLGNRLDMILKERAENGIMVMVLAWNETKLAFKFANGHAKQKLEALHPNIKVITHPGALGPIKWAHHDKIVIVDREVAFLGGFDLGFGRYDTSSHLLRDDCHLQCTWPGKDYYNPGICGLQDVNRPFDDLVDRVTTPRMPWHDIQVSVTGEVVRDLAVHFSQRWNHHKEVMGCDISYPILLPDLFVESHGATNQTEPPLSILSSHTFQNVGDGEVTFSEGNDEIVSRLVIGQPQSKHMLNAGLQRVSFDTDYAIAADATNGATMAINTDNVLDTIAHPDISGGVLTPAIPSMNTSTRTASHSGSTTPSSLHTPTFTRSANLNSAIDICLNGDSHVTVTTYEPVGRIPSSPSVISKSIVQHNSNEGISDALNDHDSPPISDDHCSSEHKYNALNSTGDAPGHALISSKGVQSKSGTYSEKFTFSPEQLTKRSGTPNKNCQRSSCHRQNLDSNHEKQYFSNSLAHRREQIFERALEQSSANIDESVGGVAGMFAGSIVEAQLLRSLCEWSGGERVEASIQTGIIDVITQAKHYVYIENQYFISRGDIGVDADNGECPVNGVAVAILNRLRIAIAQKEVFKVIIVMPVYPEGSFEKEPFVRHIMWLQYQTIHLSRRSILGALNAEYPDINMDDYISFMSLRTWARMGSQLTTEQIYVHAKIVMADDNVCVVGSMNINDRSLVGFRDSEVAVVIRDRETIPSKMDGADYQAGRFVHALRCQLWREHLGLEDSDVSVLDPICEFAYKHLWRSTASKNTAIYDKIFPMVPSNRVLTFEQYQYILHWKEREEQAPAVQSSRSKSLSSTTQKSTKNSDVCGVKFSEENVAMLNTTQGHLVHYPMKFMSQDMAISFVDCGFGYVIGNDVFF